MRVRTYRTDPARRKDGLVVVWIALLDPPAEDVERVAERTHLMVIDLFSRPPGRD